MQSTARQTRENRTITVDFQNEATYRQLLGDGKTFVELVMAFILALGFQLKHKATCQGGGCLTRHSHYVRVRLGAIHAQALQFHGLHLALHQKSGQHADPSVNKTFLASF